MIKHSNEKHERAVKRLIIYVYIFLFIFEMCVLGVFVLGRYSFVGRKGSAP